MSKTSAKEVLKKLEEDFDKRKFGVVDEKEIPFKDYAEEYLEYSKSNKAINSYKRDKTSMQSLLKHFTVPLPRITSHLIEKYKIKRLDEVKPRTINIELRCLSHMMNKAVEWRYIKESPFKGVKLFSYEKKPPRFLIKEEVQRLLDSASPWLRPILIVMLNTGIRESERARLRFKDLDFDSKKILIRSSKAKMYRAIPMNEKVEEVLKWLETNYVSSTNRVMKRDKSQMEYVFCNEDGTPVLKIKRAFANACKKAGLESVTPHTLRHTFASHLVMSGVDLNTVQRLLGHTNINTTMVYSHLTEDHLARSVERLDWGSRE